jgi:hypothetical protein
MNKICLKTNMVCFKLELDMDTSFRGLCSRNDFWLVGGTALLMYDVDNMGNGWKGIPDDDVIFGWFIEAICGALGPESTAFISMTLLQILPEISEYIRIRKKSR